MTRVLLIEHDPAERDRLGLAMHQARLEMRSTGDAAGALATLHDWSPEILVCRTDIPGLTLTAFVDAVRNQRTTRNAGIVAMLPPSAGDAAAFHEAILAGADDALVRPVDTSELLRAIRARERRAAACPASLTNDATGPEELHAVLMSAPRPATLVVLELEDAAALGATAGTEALRQLEDAWRSRIRALAPTMSSVFISTRGEAIVLLPPHTPQPRALLTAFCGTGQAPMLVAGRDLRVRAAAGIVTLGTDESVPDAETLLQRCRFALQAARRGGQPRVRDYHANDAINTLDDLQLATLLQHALEGGGFRLVYQPKVSVATGEVCGAEALIRWTVPSTGEPVPAKRLLDIAEDAGLLDEIGGWALREASRQGALWWQTGLEIPVSVNIAPTQFRRGDLVDEVRLALRESGLPGRLLGIEVQERVLQLDGGEVRDQLEAIRVSGVRVALDDFGTGIESLGLLRRFPLDELKIDHTVVERLPGSTEDRASMDITLRHARSLGIACVAVGVERAAQWAFLAERGWDAAQGWYIAKPIPGADIPAFARHDAAAIQAAANAVE